MVSHKCYAYYAGCGHREQHLMYSPDRKIPTCQSRPDVYKIHDEDETGCFGKCDKCRQGLSRPLPLRRREQIKAQILLRIAEEQKFWKDLKEKTVAAIEEALQIEICTIVTVRLWLFLHYQYSKVGHNYPELFTDEDYFRDHSYRLVRAMLQIPTGILTRLSHEERLTILEIEELVFEFDIEEFDQLALELTDQARYAHEQRIETNKEVLVTQLQLLHGIFGDDAVDYPELAERWEEVQGAISTDLRNWRAVQDEQVENRQAALHNLLVTPSNEEIVADPACSICQEIYCSARGDLEAETPVKLPCKHIFGSECITTWLSKNNTCPLCKMDFKDVLEKSSEVRPVLLTGAPRNRGIVFWDNLVRNSEAY